MSINDTIASKESLIQSKDIYTFLADLYFICSIEFTRIYNIIQKDLKKERFLHCLHSFKNDLLEKINKEDIFTTNFQKIMDVLKKVKGSTQDEHLIILWAFLKAIDLTFADDTVYLNKMRAIWCRTSKAFEPKIYRLLLKPRNLIFDTIKNKLGRGKLKTGIDIGKRIEDQMQKIILYEELPGRQIEFKSNDPSFDGLLRTQGTNLAFAVAPIYYGYDYSFKRFKSFQGVPFVIDEIKNWKEIANNIETLLKECLEEDVHIVVFPELSINEELREHISNWLKTNNTDQKIIMVVAGSFHILKDEREDRYENSCVVYRFDGKVLWEQKKMNPFQLDEDDIKKVRDFTAKGFQDFKNLFKETDRRGWEKIEISDTLVLYDSPIGRMAVTICLDYIVKENVKLLLDPHVNTVFLPAMSFSLKKMESTNRNLGNFGAASVFCANNCWAITGGEKENFKPDLASYIYIPKKDGFMRLDCSSNCDHSGCKKISRISQI